MTSRQRKTTEKQNKFLESYLRTNGDINAAVSLSKVGRASHYRWFSNDTIYKNKILEIEKKIEQKTTIEDIDVNQDEIIADSESQLFKFIKTCDVAVRSRDSLYVYGEIADANDHWILFKHTTVKNYRTNQNRYFQWYLLPMHAVDEMYPVNSYKRNKKSMNDANTFLDDTF